MREIVLDTETTGLDPFDGHRIVEIGAVELFNHVPTGKTYHQYINPLRSMPAEAFNVHGISEEYLADKPVFERIGQEFLDFVRDSRLVIHNASFDMKFLNAELEWAKLPKLANTQALDTLAIARKRFPGSPASLDALCRRFGIDNTKREKHGALLDSEILADVYLELTGGRQPDLVLGEGVSKKAKGHPSEPDWRPRPRPNPLPSRLSAAETEAHDKMIEGLGESAVWARFKT